MKVRLLRPAFDDLASAQRFYDQQQLGIGDRFLEDLFSEIDALEQDAGIHAIRFGCHRSLSKKFPYAIYYRIIAGEAVVLRVLDCRRDPARIRRAVSKTS